VFKGDFRRSGLFGIFGVIVVAAIVLVIGLTTGSGEANPKATLGLIFGVLAVFLVILFVLQRSDLERAARGNVKATTRAAAEGGRTIENPTTMSEPELWAALAIGPIDEEAIRARSQMWDAGRRSQRLVIVVVILIFLTVPSIYLLESFVPLLIGGPLIAIAAIYGAIRAIGPGGEMDRGYERVGLAMAPLGLAVTERPTVSIETRDAVTSRVGPRVHGALVLSGERQGRRVSVRLGGDERTGTSEIRVTKPTPEVGAETTPEFSAKAKDGRVRPAKDAPAAIVAVLEAVPSSTRWKRVEVEGGSNEVVVVRKGGEPADWLCDLWLAERLADA
jgi:hypothetical protein